MRRGIMMLLGAVLLGAAAGTAAAQTPAPTDAQRREKMLRALDSLDRAETLALLTQAFDCAARRDFACGKEKLAKAGRFAATDEERKLVERAGQTVTTLETATRETESARQETASVRQELAQARQAQASAQAAQAETARRQQALNWRVRTITEWIRGAAGMERTFIIACGNNYEPDIVERSASNYHAFTPMGRNFQSGVTFKTLEEAARHACS